MLLIRHTSVWCEVYNSDPKDIAWLSRFLTIKNYTYIRGRPSIKELKLFSKRFQRFPSGLLFQVASKAKEIGIALQIEDQRPSPGKTKELSERCSHLFDFQRDAIEACLRYRNGIVKLPTGSGKTEIAIGLATRVDGNTIFLVDERGLVIQARQRWQSIIGSEAGIIGDGKVEIKRFTVASIDTLQQRLKAKSAEIVDFVKSVDCLIVDECHILGARTRYRASISIPNASYRIGFSATPTGRSDHKDLYVIGATGPIIYSLSRSKLVDMGRISDGICFFYRYPGSRKENEGSTLNWSKFYDAAICKNEARNRAIIRLCRVSEKPVLVFFERKAHGYHLLHELQSDGFSVKIVHGDYSGQDRKRLADQLCSGQIQILLCSRIFNKGWDLPEIMTAINAAGNKAEIMSIQRIGRAARISHSKARYVYWELLDTHHDKLTQHARERYKTYKREGIRVDVVDSLSAAGKILKSIS